MPHTPGPWSVKRGHSVLNVDGPNGEHVAACGDGPYWQPHEKRASANAHLVSAAPDLLGALLAVRDWIELEIDTSEQFNLASGDPIEGFCAEENELLQLIDAAIAKAEGRHSSSEQAA